MPVRTLRSNDAGVRSRHDAAVRRRERRQHLALAREPGTDRPSREALDALHRQYAVDRDPVIREQLVDAYSGLAAHLAGRFANRGEAYDDLRQVAMLALLKALNGFDPNVGVRFSTYAAPTILGELKRYLRDRSWAVRPPRWVHDLYLHLQGAIDELTHELGRAPTIPEIAERTAAPVEQVLEALEAGEWRHATSLDAPTGDADARPLSASVGGIDERFADVERAVTLPALLARLSEYERELVRLRFDEGLIQQEIANRLGTSQMQVSRLLTRTVRRLQAFAGEG